MKSDYENLCDSNGEKYDLVLFKTTHRAMESRGCKRIFVDEFTSLPMEFLACIADFNGAEEIFLVGDDKQSRVIEPDEGLYIGNHISTLIRYQYMSYWLTFITHRTPWRSLINDMVVP